MMFLSSIFPDVDECLSGEHQCSEFAQCHNLIGSHNCVCNHGFSGDGWNCSGEKKKHSFVTVHWSRCLVFMINFLLRFTTASDTFLKCCSCHRHWWMPYSEWRLSPCCQLHQPARRLLLFLSTRHARQRLRLSERELFCVTPWQFHTLEEVFASCYCFLFFYLLRFRGKLLTMWYAKCTVLLQF